MAKVNHCKEMYQFSLEDARILSINFDLKQVKNESEDISLESKFNVSHSVLNEGNGLRVAISIHICGDSAPFDLKTTYGGLFKFDTPIQDEKQIEYVAEVNCASILFPFIREVVADLTRRAGYAPLLLPPINLMEIYKNNHPDS